jgi:peptidoglycan-associated lipoprotein
MALIGLTAGSLVFAGCSTTGSGDAAGGATASGATASGATASGAAEGSAADAGGASTAARARRAGYSGTMRLDDPASILAVRKIYFEFDSSEISFDNKLVLRAHSEHLNANSTTNITIEGHADERGSREYNIALGERRANAIKAYMTAEGVNPAQLNVVSFGEERPELMGHDANAWSKNRRGVLVY